MPLSRRKLHRRLDQRVEHRLQVERRAADDLQHVGGRGLLLQRLARVARAACTSSNSRTFSIAMTAWSAKVWTSSICRVGERRRLAAGQREYADHFVFAQQRDRRDRAEAAELRAPS